MTDVSKRLAEITVSRVESYLLSHDWVKDGDIRRVATVWHRRDSDDAEVVLPLSSSVKDYAQRMQDALEALATHEKRQVIEVVDDVVNLSSNIIAVRVMGTDTSEGTIPFNDGVLLITKAKELLYAAAMSLYSKRKVFSGALSKDTKSYLDSLLLGQTAVGSYIVNVIAPLPQQAAPTLDTDGIHVAEGVTFNLVTGLEALTQASELYEQTNDLAVFEAAVAKGASANMCDALLGFSGSEHKREFEIRVSGAAGPLFKGETKVYSFDAADVEALQKASGYYKDDYILNGREVWGIIKKLSRPKGEEVGTITVEASVGESERNVQIELGPDDYHLAVLAHDTKAIVKCRGDVHIKSRSARLLNPAGFQVVQIGDLF